MEVKDKCAALLSNYEVLLLLQENKHKSVGQKKNSQLKNLATISYQALKYLEGSACSRQSESAIRQCLLALDKFKLTKSEKLQIVNLRPTTAVEVQIIVEESEERLRDEDVEELLALVAQHLPEPPQQTAENSGSV